MLNENILKNFISNFDREASYSVIITDIQQEHKCNKDVITFDTQYINPNLFTIIKNQSDLIDDISKAETMAQVAATLTQYSTIATDISQVINRTLTLRSELDVDEKNKMYLSKLNGFQNTIEKDNLPKSSVEGTITNGASKIKSPDFPSRITFKDIRVTPNTIAIKIKENIKNVVLKVDDVEYQGTVTNNVFTAIVNGVHTGSHKFEITYDLDSDLVTKNIEIMVTEMGKSIEFDFEKEYNEIPCIYITIDEKYSTLYSKYTTNFKGKYVCQNCKYVHEGYEPLDECPSCFQNKFELEKYIGVQVNFKNLKRRTSYPKINITTIGGHYNTPPVTVEEPQETNNG